MVTSSLEFQERSEDTSDEHCTIFYDKEKVELLEGGTFWLSESPSVPWEFQLKQVEPPGFQFQIVNTNMDEFSSRARRRSALLTWQHIASLPPSLPVVYCGGFNTQKESTTGRFLIGRSRWYSRMSFFVLFICTFVLTFTLISSFVPTFTSSDQKKLARHNKKRGKETKWKNKTTKTSPASLA